MSDTNIQSSNLHRLCDYTDNIPTAIKSEFLTNLGDFARLAQDPATDALAEAQIVWFNTSENVIKYWSGSEIAVVLSSSGLDLKLNISDILSDLPQEGSSDDVNTKVIGALALRNTLEGKLNTSDIIDSVPLDGSADDVDSKVLSVSAAKDGLDQKFNVSDILIQTPDDGDPDDSNTKILGTAALKDALDLKINTDNLLAEIPLEGSAGDDNANIIGAQSLRSALDNKADSRLQNVPADLETAHKTQFRERVDIQETLTTDQLAVVDANPYLDADVDSLAGKYNFSVINNGILGDPTDDTPTYSVARMDELLAERHITLTDEQLAVIDANPFLDADVMALAGKADETTVASRLVNKLDTDGQNLNASLTEDQQSTIRHRIDASEPILRRTGGRVVADLGADFSHPSVSNSSTLLITMALASERDISLETFFQAGFIEIEDGSLPEADRVPYLVIKSEAQGTDGILLTFSPLATFAASTGFTSGLILHEVETDVILEASGGGTGHRIVIPTQYTDAMADARITAATTDDLSEGTTNLYYTEARADARVTAGIAAATTDDLTEGATNLYYTTDRANTDIVAQIADSDTDDIAEAGNLYYTEDRVDARVQIGFNDADNVPQMGTVPADWDDLGGGADIPFTGTGQNIIGVTTDGTNVTGVELGTITGGGGGGGLDQYTVDTEYAVDDVVWRLADEKLYRTLTAHTSGGTLADFNSTLWSELSEDAGVTSVTQNSTGGIDVVQDGVSTTLANEVILRSDHSTIWNAAGAPPNSLGATGSIAFDDTGAGLNTIYAQQSSGSWVTLPLDITASPVAGVVTGISGTDVNFSAATSGNRLNIAGNGAGLVRYGNVIVEQPDNALSIRMASGGFFGGAEADTVQVTINSNSYDSTAYTFQGLTLHFVDGLALNAAEDALIEGDGVWSLTATPLISNSWTAFG